jgi:hypothetical protein
MVAATAHAGVWPRASATHEVTTIGRQVSAIQVSWAAAVA